MRVSSELWVKAHIRRCAGVGIPAFVVRHGDDRAGAIFLKVNLLDGRALVFGPAPSGFAPEPDERRWVVHLGPNQEHEIDAYLARQFEFDADIWIVELEDAQGRAFPDE